MKIRRLELRNFRKFIEPVAIEGLGDGLTVIAGDNEEGKSTLLKALRTVLFDRHGLTGEAAEALRPFGSEVRPEIHLDFELAGQSYRLRKGFCQQKFAEMDVPAGRISGPAVEDKLQELLRFDPPGRGSARPENQGIWGMFWLEQGTTFDNLAFQARARQTVLSALEGEVGAVLGGQRGRDLLDTIGSRYGVLFDAREHPRGEYKKALERKSSLQEELTKVQTELHAYDAKVDELAKARDRLARYEAEGRLARVLRERDEAEKEQRRIESLVAALKAATQQEQVARTEAKAAGARWQRREDELHAGAEADTAVVRLRLAVEAEQQALNPQERAVEEARAAYDSAAQAQDRSEVEARRWERLEQRARAAETLSALRKRSMAAIEALQNSRQAHTQAQAITVDDKKVRKLRQLEKEALEAEAGLNAVATRLTFTLETGVSLRLAGQRLADGKPLLLAETTSLEIQKNNERLGILTITPGAEDLSERQKRSDAAQQKLGAELKALGLLNVAAAEVQVKERTALEARAQQQEKLAEAHSPEGIDVLSSAIERAEAELVVGTEEQDELLTTDEVAEELRAARSKLEETTKQTKHHRVYWDTESRTLQAAQMSLTKVEAALKEASNTQKKAHEILEAARQREDDASLSAGVAEQKRRLQEAEVVTQSAHEAHTSAAPEEARLRLEAKTQAAECIRREIEESSKLATGLEIELRTLGHRGLGEQEQELVGKLEQARVVAGRFDREAEAIRLLYQTLRGAEREAKEAFLEPVRRRVQPYLNLLMPGSELVLGDNDLSISHLRRGGKDEPFDSLSIGTREQLAVLTRLGFADLLREQGQPAAVVLDDALVYADDARFERMLIVLRRAAQHQQIIVLTCRERDYVSAGFPVIRLSSCQHAGAAAGPQVALQ